MSGALVRKLGAFVDLTDAEISALEIFEAEDILFEIATQMLSLRGSRA